MSTWDQRECECTPEQTAVQHMKKGEQRTMTLHSLKVIHRCTFS
jgi:hypothetical protein